MRNESEAFSIRFRPRATGVRRATVSIANTDADENPYRFDIIGNGVGTPVPEIDVRGNNVSIAGGETTPTASAGTDFGKAEVAGGSVTRTFTVANLGTGALNLTGNPLVQITGPQAGDFAILAQPGTPVAAPGGSSTFRAKFDPSAGGLRTATVTLRSNDADEGTYTFTIQGIGTVPAMEVRGNNQPIAGGDASPTTDDGTDFGGTDVAGGTVSRSFKIYNQGEATLHLTGNPRVEISGANAGDFTVAAQPPATVAPNGVWRSFQLKFDPSAAGVRRATVTIAGDDPDHASYTFAVSGEGQQPDIEVRGNNVVIAGGDTTPTAGDNTSFGSTDVSSGTLSKVFTIVNAGNGSLNLTDNPEVTITGPGAADFALVSRPTTPIPPGSSADFELRFDPHAVGASNASITIHSNDPDEATYSFAIRGVGVASAYMVVLGGPKLDQAIESGDTTPSLDDSTDFGENGIWGQPVTKMLLISNYGSMTLNLTAIPSVQITGPNAGDFVVESAPGASVARDGGTTTFVLRFHAAALGLRRATVHIYSNDPSHSEYRFDILGLGTDSA